MKVNDDMGSGLDFALFQYLNFKDEKSNSCRPTCVPFQQSQK